MNSTVERSSRTGFWWAAGIIAATSVGAGIFSLPYLFSEAGWVIGVVYLVVLGVFVSVAHFLYWRTLRTVRERDRLLGLSRTQFGTAGFLLAFLSIVGGLILALVIYLILARQFITLLVPGVGGTLALTAFWVAASLPLLVALRRLIRLEFLGTIAIGVIILLIVATASSPGALFRTPAFDWQRALFPFGAILFSFAGWTAIEPILEYEARSRVRIRRPFLAMAVGSLIAAVVYGLFVVGVFGSAGAIAEDTVSGIGGWPPWKQGLLGALGLFAMWTSYVPVSLEVKNALEKDLRWPAAAALATVLGVPLLLIALGLERFLTVVGLAGGIFLSVQYVFIVLVAKRVLQLRVSSRALLGALALLFVLAALYEVYYFLL